MLVLRSLRQTCLISPSQWEGETTDGRPAFIRYRHGELTVRVGPIDGSIDDAIRCSPIFAEECGDKHGCMLEWHEAAMFAGLELLEP